LITRSFSKEPIQKLRIEEIDRLAEEEIKQSTDLAEFAKSVLRGEVQKNRKIRTALNSQG